MDKTYAMLFTNRLNAATNNEPIYMNDKQVKFKICEDFLGLILDNHLKFTDHINFVCKKLSKTVGILYKLKNYVPKRTLVNLYYSLAYPYLLYANLIWGGTYDVHLSPLFMLQKKLIRIINNADFLAHTEPLFKTNNILKLKDLHEYLLAQYTHKQHIQHDSMFDNIHSYNTRNNNRARTAFQRLTQTQLSLSYAGPKAWNAQPQCIRNAETINIFKKQVKNHYLAKYNY